jgi:DnaJ-domain-containing protein 1
MRETLARVDLCKLRESRELTAFGFGVDELAAAELLELRPMTVAELGATELLRPDLAERLVYALALTGHIEATAPPPRQSTQRLSAVNGPSAHAPPPISTRSSGLRRMLTPRGVASVRGPRAVAATAPGRPDSIRPDVMGRLAIAERAKHIGEEDYFDALGVSHDASPDAIRAAFFRLSKVWHPDRLPAELRDLSEECARVFACLTTAYDTLRDDVARDAYRARLDAAGTEATPADVKDLLREAETALLRGDLARAEEHCRRACEASPNDAGAIALSAWVLASHPHAAPDVVSEAITALGRAIRLDGHCETAFFYRAELRRRSGALELAIGDYRRVVALDPRHVAAMREVRVYEMRVRNGTIRPARPASTDSTADKISGFFSKLTRKST